MDIKFKNFAIDLIVVFLGGLSHIILAIVVKPTKRGFFCNDESIRYPNKWSTISNLVLYICGIFIPIIVITITEYVVGRKTRNSAFFLNFQVPIWLIDMYNSLVYFLFGCICSQMITDIGKVTIGRLRPNFINVCRPQNLSAICSDHMKYINYDEFECTFVNDEYEKSITESRVSFPSGHSSLSAYAMLYLVIFIQCKWNTKQDTHLRLVKNFCQLILIAFSYFTAISRVMDNKHHWSDVLCGLFIGSITAFVIAKYVCTFNDSPLEKEAEEKSVHKVIISSNGEKFEEINMNL